MSGIIRNILIIDDDITMNRQKEKAYLEIYHEMPIPSEKIYDLVFRWCDSIAEAEEYFCRRDASIDVALIDYEFCNDDKARTGIDLVREIREKVSKRCRIVFYTGRGIINIERKDLLNLINNDVFRFVDKAGNFPPCKWPRIPKYNDADQIIVEAIVEALDELDPFSRALETYMIEHSAIIGKMTLSVDDKKFTFDEILDSIRMEREPGQTFVKNLLQANLMDFIELRER